MTSLLYPVVIQAVFVYLSIERREWILSDTVTAFSLTGLFLLELFQVVPISRTKNLQNNCGGFLQAGCSFCHLMQECQSTEWWQLCVRVIVCRTLNLMWWRFFVAEHVYDTSCRHSGSWTRTLCRHWALQNLHSSHSTTSLITTRKAFARLLLLYLLSKGRSWLSCWGLELTPGGASCRLRGEAENQAICHCG